MSRQQVGEFAFVFKRTKRVTIPGGFTTVPDGEEEVTYSVSVDAEAIAHWCASRARDSKRGEARGMGGAVRVKVVNRKEVRS